MHPARQHDGSAIAAATQSQRFQAQGRPQMGGRAVEMRAIHDVLTKLRIAVAMLRNILRNRTLSFIVRSLAILSMSFAAAFGFLAASQSPAAHYDPHAWASGIAGLFGAACGAIGLLVSKLRQLRAELREARSRGEDSADRIWEREEAQER